MAKPLRLAIDESAKVAIERILSSSRLKDPVPSLSFGRVSGQAQDKWIVGAYDATGAKQVEDMLKAQGIEALYQVGTTLMCIYQHHLIPELDGKTLYFHEDPYRFEVR